MRRAPARRRRPAARRDVLQRHGSAVMALPIVVFLVVSGLVLGVAALMKRRSSAAASRQLLQRLKEVGESNQAVSSAIAVVRRTGQGAVPALDRLVSGT